MKLVKNACLITTLVTAASAVAQVPIAPFAPMPGETFDTKLPGTYASFPGFAAVGFFSTTGGTGGLQINNSVAILPFLSFANDMYGRGANVRIRFNGLRHRFGGYFRVPMTSVVVTSAKYEFYRTGVFIGSIVGAVNNVAWLWHGYNLAALGGYDEVRISGNGSIPGYVGMDSLAIQ